VGLMGRSLACSYRGHSGGHPACSLAEVCQAGERKVKSKIEDFCKIFVSASALRIHGVVRRRTGGVITLPPGWHGGSARRGSHRQPQSLLLCCSLVSPVLCSRRETLCCLAIQRVCAVWHLRATAIISCPHRGSLYAIPALDLWPLSTRSRQCLPLARGAGLAPDPESLWCAVPPGYPSGPLGHKRRTLQAGLARTGGERGGPARVYWRTPQNAR